MELKDGKDGCLFCVQVTTDNISSSPVYSLLLLTVHPLQSVFPILWCDWGIEKVS